MATIRLIPSNYDVSYSSRVTVTNDTNMYYNTDHTANYASIRGYTSTITTYYAFINGFNFNDVPSDAIVNSFTVKIRCYRNSYQQTGSSYNLRLSSTASNNNVISNTTTSTAIGTSASVITIPTGNLTWSQLSGYGSNFSIEIPLLTSSRNNYPYVYVYGAEIEVDYTLPVYHNVSVSVETDKVTSVSPSTTQSVQEGTDYELHIISSNTPGDDFKVEDNNVEVTNQLVAHYPETSGNTVLGEYSLMSGSFYNGESYFQGLVGKGVNNTQTTSNYYSSGNGTIAVFTYKLEFSNIPSNATITNLYVQVNGHCENASQSSEYMCVQIMTGSTALSDEFNFKSAGTSNTTQTINATTLPTVSQLSDLKLQCRLGYYGGAINGATAYIEYEIPGSSSDPDYYIYIIENIVADHAIVISDAIIEIPEEDPQKTYYPTTISGINCTTTPSKGTNRVEAGTSQTITIYPTESQVTLITDNGVDVSSQLVQHGGTISNPTVATATGASYGFTLNSGTGYYVSQNTGVDKSAAVCVVNFDLHVSCLVTIQYINYAEATYDFGIFGNIDVPLTNNYKPASGSMPDSNYKLACNTSTYNTANVQTITYEIPSGEHQIYIKYSKDDASAENNDSLQWKIASIEPLEANNYYTYTLSNINQEHSLIFIFGNVIYYFVNSSINGEAILYPNGSMVALPGDNYNLTIVPKVTGGTLMLTDNNVDRTSQVQTKTITITKDGQPVTVTNYIYSLSNVQATHNISVTYSTQSTYEIRQVNNSLDLTISPSGTQEVDAGDNYTVSITTSKPGTITVTDSILGASTYNVSLSDVSGGSKTVTHTLTNIRASKTLTFDFTELTKYTVSASENSTYLSIPSGYASQSVYSGQSCDVKFTSTTPGTITVSDNGTNTNYTVSSANQTITHTISSVVAAHTVTATFAIATYAVSTSLKSGSETVTINPASSNVNYNGSYTVTLTPSVPGTLTISEGSTTLQTWTIPVGDLSAKTYTVNNITATHTYTVNLTELTKYTVSASENSTYLSIPSGYTSQSIYSGQSCDVKFTSTTPGTITVTDNGNNTNYPVTANSTITHTIASVNAAHTVSATFTIASYAVSASSSVTGVTLTPASQSINHGSSCNVTITSTNPGTVVITDNGTDSSYTINAANGTATHTISSVTAAHTVTVKSFTIAKYNVITNLKSGSKSVTINPSTTQQVNYNDSYTVTLTPSVPGTLTISEGSTTLQTWSIPVGDLSAKTYTVNNINATHTYTVNLTELTKYTVSASENSEYLSIPSGYTSQSIYSGQSCDVKFTSTTPGTITVSDNGTNTNYPVIANGTITHTIASVIADHTVSATFSTVTYNVSASLNSGSALVTLNPSGIQPIGHGSTYTLSMTPSVPGTLTISEDSTILETWVIPVGNLSAKTYTVENITSAHTYVVNLTELTKYNVTASESSEYLSIPSGYASQSIYSGQSCDVKFTSTTPGTITVSDNDTDTNYTVSSSNQTITHTISSVTAAHTISATFTIATYSVSASSSITGVTLTPTSQTIDYGQNTTITIKSTNPGTVVITDNGTDSSYTISVANGTITHTISSVTAAHTITVKSFTLAKYTVTATKGSGVTSVSPASQSLDYGSNVSLTVTPTTPGTLTIKETNLPYDAEIEYLESTGDAFIETSIKGNTSDVIQIKYSTVSKNNSTEWHYIIGYITNESDRFGIYLQNSNYINIDYWAGSGTTNRKTNIITQTLNTIYNYEIGNCYLKNIDTNSIIKTYTTLNEKNSNLTYKLFDNRSAKRGARTTRIYKCKIYKDNTLVRDLIPVKVDNVGYMYDKVSGQLFGNAGTGSFTLGPDIDTSGTLTIYEQEISSSEAGTSITCLNIYTNLSANHSVIASLTGLGQHTVTVTNNSSSILSYTPSSPISIYDGETLTINFVPTQQGTLTVTDSVSSSNNQTYTITSSDINVAKVYTIDNVTADRTITANLTIASYTVTASSSVTGVTLTPASQSINHGENTSITITSTTPGTVVITDNGTDHSYNITAPNGTATYTISSVTATHTITVKSFTIAKYNIITNLKSGSKSVTINPSTIQQVNYNDSYTVILTPSVPGTLTISEDSTTLQTWTIPVDNLAAKTYTVNNVTTTHTYTANLTELTKYNVSITNNSSTYLTVTPSSTQSIYSGQNATIQIKTTKAGTVSITDNVTGNTSYLEYSNSELNTNKSFTLENITSAHTLTISLAAQTYPVSVSTSSEYITITSQTPVNIADGSNYQVTATASIPGTVTLKEGNTIINSANVTLPNGTYSYNVTNITSQRTFTLLFTPTNYTVSASVSSGSDVTIISGASYSGIYGTQYTLTFRSGSIGTVSVNDSGTVTTYTIGPDEVNQTRTYQKTVTSNSTIKLSNSIDTYDITGTIASGSITYLKYVDNGTDKTSISKTVNAGSNYVLNIKSTHPGTLSLTINGETSNITLNDSYTYPYIYQYEITNILSAVSVSASFSVLTFDIQDNGSTIDNIVYGQSYTYTFTPATAGTYNLYDNDNIIETYNIAAAQVGIEKSYTINRVTSPHNFRVSSTVSTYTITVTNNAQTYISNINISNRNPEYNGSSVITIYPRLKGTINITDNNGTPTTISTTGVQKEYTLQNITGDHTIVITFTPGTYVATLTNNIPSTYNYTLSKNSGNYNVTGCETFSFTLSANQTGSSKTIMNGKVIVARTISGSTIRKIYSIIKDTPFSATYEVDDVVNDMTITLTFEETQEAPANGDRFLKPFNTDNEAQAYVANNNPNPFIYYDRLTHYVNYTSHLGNMRMTTQIYRGGNGHKLFERD